MDSHLLDALRNEAASLEQKLSAVRHTLAIYGEQASELDAPAAPYVPHIPARAGAKVRRASNYADKLRRIARDTIAAEAPDPVPTREIVDAVKTGGVEIRGQNDLNAVSALLSRHEDFVSNGRAGWTLAQHVQDTGLSQNENGELNSHAASSPDVGKEGVPAPSNPWNQPHLSQAS